MSIFSQSDLERLAAVYPQRPGKIGHGLVGHPLLTLEALVGLAARMDRKDVEYNAGDLPYGIDPAHVHANGLSPEETIRRIEECGSWMVLKNVQKDPAYAELLEEALGEAARAIRPVTGELLTKAAFVFVSSPGAVTPFHHDPEHNILLQIRGSKTMLIVPDEEDIVPAEKHESYHVGGHRNIVWRDEFEGRGEKYELTPGEALHVPVMWPHWVRNGPETSISFSITWKSRWVYEEADARGMNHLLRKAGLKPKAPAAFPKANKGKAVAFRAIRKARSRVGL